MKNLIFSDPLNLLLGTSDDSKWHPKGPRTILGKMFIDHFQLFWSPFFAAAKAAATTRLSDGSEKVFNNFTPENLYFYVFLVFLILAAEKVFSDFTPKNDFIFYSIYK